MYKGGYRAWWEERQASKQKTKEPSLLTPPERHKASKRKTPLERQASKWKTPPERQASKQKTQLERQAFTGNPGKKPMGGTMGNHGAALFTPPFIPATKCRKMHNKTAQEERRITRSSAAPKGKLLPKGKSAKRKKK
jgi:hypothetical protein